MLMDDGGSNLSRHYLFKQDIQTVADEIGIEIRIANFTPYISKWNPIEHRVFPHITRSLIRVCFDNTSADKRINRKNNDKGGVKNSCLHF